MNRFTASLWMATAAALLLGGAVQAAPPTWTYDWKADKTTINADPSANVSKIKLLDEATPPGITVQTNQTDTTAVTIKVESNAPAGFPDVFTIDGNVKLTLTIKDGGPAGPAQSFNFFGTFNAPNSTVAQGEANVKFQLTSAMPAPDQLIGSNYYTITYNGYTPPPPPGSALAGSISFNVAVRPLDIQKAPEPTSLLLAGLGASFMGFGAWRKRRQQSVVETA